VPHDQGLAISVLVGEEKPETMILAVVNDYRPGERPVSGRREGDPL
jgi:hypothetical protein